MAAGVGAGLLQSTQPGAREGPASAELSLSHAWKKPPQELQRRPAGMQGRAHLALGRQQVGSRISPFIFSSQPDRKILGSWWERRDSLNQQFAVSTEAARSARYLVNKPCSEKERPVCKSSS